MNDLNRAKDNLNKFLIEHPELISFQMKINEILQKGNTPEERIIILTKLIRSNIEHLSNETTLLRDMLEGDSWDS